MSDCPDTCRLFSHDSHTATASNKLIHLNTGSLAQKMVSRKKLYIYNTCNGQNHIKSIFGSNLAQCAGTHNLYKPLMSFLATIN
ncbi:hypothetical protein E3Q17_03861 [Wallemia mellicola]|uniref:Uncharacterized protein n=1 Tax=Wallemia mellicola TaxID=1708541 RepID=A0A4T0NJG4_9BASI|nr:hypothetical protein E3Q17_03861 [Wallemia mellicola]